VLWVLSPDLVILEINHAASEILGYNPEQVRGQPLEAVFNWRGYITYYHCKMPITARKIWIPSIYGCTDDPVRRPGTVPLLSNLIDGKLDKILILLQDLTEQEVIREQNSPLEQRAILVKSLRFLRMKFATNQYISTG